MRLIQFHGTLNGKKSWLAPVLLLLAAVGAGVLMLAAAAVGIVALAAGTAMKLLRGGSVNAGQTAGPARPSLLGGWLKKIFIANAPNQSRSPENDPKTISLDRGDDGVWRP